jgi:hypothetical protein
MNAVGGDPYFSRTKRFPPSIAGAVAVDPSRIAPLSGDRSQAV